MRFAAIEAGTIARLPAPSQAAADHSYIRTVERLCEGLEKVLETCALANDPTKKRLAALWAETRAD
jgi:hypothetical protein